MIFVVLKLRYERAIETMKLGIFLSIDLIILVREDSSGVDRTRLSDGHNYTFGGANFLEIYYFISDIINNLL